MRMFYFGCCRCRCVRYAWCQKSLLNDISIFGITTHFATDTSQQRIYKRKKQKRVNFDELKMFFWVLLNCDRKILVPINHCDFSTVSMWEFYNGGGVGKKIPKLFYSDNKRADANFELDVSETFEKGVDACYSGRILACFGEKFFNVLNNKQFLMSRILGTEHEAVAAGLLNESDIGEPFDFESDDTAVKQENEEELQEKRNQQLELLKKAATYLRNRIGPNDILDGELADFQEVLNGEEDEINEMIGDESVPPVDSVNANLVVDGRTLDGFSGYMDFVISVRNLLFLF